MEKREHEDSSAGADAAKRARTDAQAGHPAAPSNGTQQGAPRPGAQPGGAGKPGLSKETLEKAKQALQKQKELTEKLKKYPQVRNLLMCVCQGPACYADVLLYTWA